MAAVIGLNVSFEGFAAMLAEKTNLPLKRATDRSAGKAYGYALQYWHQEFLPFHFTRQATTRYKYQKRKKPYSAIKRRLGMGQGAVDGNGVPIRGRDAVVRKGGLVDNVRGGNTERMARAGYLLKTSGKRAVLTMMVPRYISMRRRDPSKPNMGAEITTIVRNERVPLVKAADEMFQEELRREVRKARRRRGRF